MDASAPARRSYECARYVYTRSLAAMVSRAVDGHRAEAFDDGRTTAEVPPEGIVGRGICRNLYRFGRQAMRSCRGHVVMADRLALVILPIVYHPGRPLKGEREKRRATVVRVRSHSSSLVSTEGGPAVRIEPVGTRLTNSMAADSG